MIIFQGQIQNLQIFKSSYLFNSDEKKTCDVLGQL